MKKESVIAKHFMNRNILIRQLYVRRRLILSFLLGIVFFLVIPNYLPVRDMTRLIISWDVGVLLYLCLGGFVMMTASHEQMRAQARLQDEGAFAILTLTILAVIASLAALAGELVIVRELEGTAKYAHIVLTVVTLMFSWIFMHMAFAFHYAHMYYVAIDANLRGGLDFPSDEKPDYADFLYFSCVIGTSGQTADVGISSKEIRRISLVHCIIAFMFNTTILALTVNIASNLL